MHRLVSVAGPSDFYSTGYYDPEDEDELGQITELINIGLQAYGGKRNKDKAKRASEREAHRARAAQRKLDLEELARLRAAAAEPAQAGFGGGGLMPLIVMGGLLAAVVFMRPARTRR